MTERVLSAGLTFACLWLVYGALERAFPARAARSVREPDFLTDACFFLGQYLAFSSLSLALLSEVHGAARVLVPFGVGGFASSMPAWVVAVVAVVLGDALVYGFHRACHRFDSLWRFHAVHHSSERLDWLAAHREHPVDGMLTQLAQNLPAMVLGVHFDVLAVLIVFRGAWSILIHSNVRLPLGPLRVLFGAPELHHFHHARVERTAHNFGNLAPWLDVVFGTYRRPAMDEKYPLGLSEAWPKGYFAQLAAPFRSRGSASRRALRSEALLVTLSLLGSLGCGSQSPAPVGPSASRAEARVIVPTQPSPQPSPVVPLAAPSAPPEEAPECMNEGAKDRYLIAAPCSGSCTSFRIEPRRCEGGRWQKLPPIEPVCACAPASVPASLQGCKARTIVLTPTEEGASDGVNLTLTCGKTLLDVTCDGENDGTGTSLCECQRDGVEVRMRGNPWPGEGISVAYLAAERCLGQR